MSWHAAHRPASAASVRHPSLPAPRDCLHNPGLEAVFGAHLGIARGDELREIEDDLRLLPRGVVLHLAVDHDRAGAVRHGIHDALGEVHLGRVQAEHALGDVDLARMQRPGAGASVQERVAELRLAGGCVRKIAERSVEGLQIVARARVHHAGQRVVPEVLLEEGAWRVRLARVGQNSVGGMATADARRFHAAGGRKISRAEAHAVHARARRGDGFDVLHAFGGFKNGVDQDRFWQRVLGFELREELVQVVDVPRPFDLRQHDHVELAADGRHDLENVVERPGRVERIDARPQSRLAVVEGAGHGDEALPCRDLGVGRDGVLEIAEHDVHLGDQIADAGADLLVVRRDEMHHALQPHGQLAEGGRRAGGER